ncbi:type II secretion system F family protein [Methanothermococcus okinawensis]|uniref:Type II secretion system F domain protein n=1 Tax=Methanothermococcus okinawensis (strain DSM 14208 / JCM 11175 / IH1) TaxID=647113 RepID=F8AL87_METOI|nr:type II secretion system F family protein [Methanothermococcus okinawensis]AEH06692.1 Type II secretion system F domain protein [Methanothermococcus okinawensis IH1]
MKKSTHKSLRESYKQLRLKRTLLFRKIHTSMLKYYDELRKLIDNILYMDLKIGGRRRRIQKRRVSITHVKKLIEAHKEQDIGLTEFYDVYVEKKPDVKVDVDIDLDELIEKSYFNMLNEYSKNLSYFVTHTKYLPSKIDFQYAGIRDVKVYFLKLMFVSMGVGVIYFVNGVYDENILYGIINGVFASAILFIAGIFYPKIKLLLLSRGEIKIQILISILHMISSLNSGMSLQEAMKNISENPEYGIASFEFKNIIYDINRGGYSFKESLERAKIRTKIPLMKKLYAQLIISANKGGAQLLLKNLYNEVIRESISKIDSSKFQISNLGNLVFGVGMILPFAGMLLSSLQGGMGFSGIINTTNLLLTKIAPMATIVFTIFIKMKIE